MKRYFAFAILLSTIATSVPAQQAQKPDVRDFVRGNAFPRSYSELSASYDASATPELVAMLNSKTDENHWARVAGMLGAIGDDRAVDALIAFVERPVNTLHLSQAQHDGRREAIRALGFLVNRTGNERALNYLIDGLTPSVWRQRNVQGIAPWMNSYAEYDLRLSKYALFGLALSGAPRAGAALRALQQSPTPEQAQLRSGLDDTLAQWLEVYDLVAERGVAGMYKYYETRQRLKADQGAEVFVPSGR